MSIAFACSRCGKHYTVDAALAGRQGRCKVCGRMMHVPGFSDDGDDTIAVEGYDLSEPLPIAAEPEFGSTFVPAGIDPEVPRTARTRRPATETTQRRSRRDEEEASVAGRLKILIAAPLVLLAILGLIALLVPNGTLIAACALGGVGGLLILVGYGVGLWAAFQEDAIQGFAYLFPLYAAYYIVTRWDGMWPFFVAMTVGAGLVALGGTIAGSKLGDEKPRAAAGVDMSRPVVFATVSWRT
jgi:hypothetical protein